MQNGQRATTPAAAARAYKYMARLLLDVPPILYLFLATGKFQGERLRHRHRIFWLLVVGRVGKREKSNTEAAACDTTTTTTKCTLFPLPTPKYENHFYFRPIARAQATAIKIKKRFELLWYPLAWLIGYSFHLIRVRIICFLCASVRLLFIGAQTGCRE